MADRELSVDHTTVWRWVQKYAPVLHQEIRRERTRVSVERRPLTRFGLEMTVLVDQGARLNDTVFEIVPSFAVTSAICPLRMNRA